MAKIQGMKEKLHLPLYDAFLVPDNQSTFGQVMRKRDPRVIRFFVDVQEKTRLETNLQASSVLPSFNTFEARALRVVASTPPLELNKDKIIEAGDKYCTDKGSTNSDTKQNAGPNLVNAINAECDSACMAARSILPELIYGSVTTLLVGEKIMIEMPTFWFPAGAGVSPGNGSVTNHGEPDPTATFRFAEPVFIEKQQNFRVEMLFPQGVPNAVDKATGPLRVWVILDGYLTRDVQ